MGDRTLLEEEEGGDGVGGADGAGGAADGADGAGADGGGEEAFLLTLPARKKRRRREGAGSAGLAGLAGSGWRGFEYREMLERVYEQLRGRPGAAGRSGGAGAGAGRSMEIPPPQVIKLGSKKTGVANFGAIVNRLRRSADHVQEYLLAELGTSGTLDGGGVLVLKGKHSRSHVETVLARYVHEYVRCRACCGHFTELGRNKHTRLTYLSCNECMGRSTVERVGSGFVALTEKRSLVRRREEL